LREITFTQAQAQAAATVDDTYYHDATPAGLLGKMIARGGTVANVAAAIGAGRIRLRPLTMRHDSTAYVTAQLGAPDPSQVGYFVGPTCATSLSRCGGGGFSLGGPATSS
jgi:hypothetical protein